MKTQTMTGFELGGGGCQRHCTTLERVFRDHFLRFFTLSTNFCKTVGHDFCFLGDGHSVRKLKFKKCTAFLWSLFVKNAFTMELSRHSEKPENQAGNLRRFSDYSESHSREISAMRLRLGGRNDGEPSPEFLDSLRSSTNSALSQGERAIISPLPLGEGGTECRVRVKKVAFTLAEVLITLGIIGVVAAMTLPTLIQKHTNSVVETKLAKFYTTFNQAIQLAEVEYGDRKYWYERDSSSELDDDGNPIPGTSKAEKWWKKYIGPNMPTIKITYDDLGKPSFYLKDGSVVEFAHEANMGDVKFYTMEREKCYKKYNNPYGICAFYFYYNPVAAQYLEQKYHKNKGLEPYLYGWDGTEEQLLQNCTNDTYRVFCTALIQHNGWKIPKNYPHKVAY